jgi:hypothetical protein
MRDLANSHPVVIRRRVGKSIDGLGDLSNGRKSKVEIDEVVAVKQEVTFGEEQEPFSMDLKLEEV